MQLEAVCRYSRKHGLTISIKGVRFLHHFISSLLICNFLLLESREIEKNLIHFSMDSESFDYGYIPDYIYVIIRVIALSLEMSSR